MRFNTSKCSIIRMGNAKSQFFYQLDKQIVQSLSKKWMLPSHMTWAGTSTLPLSSVRPTSGWVLSSIIFVEAHTSTGRPPTSPWPGPNCNTVPSFGILSSSATPLKSYSGRPRRGRPHQRHPAHLQDFKWHLLAVRIVSLCKILHGLVNILPEPVDGINSSRTPRGVSNPLKL